MTLVRVESGHGRLWMVDGWRDGVVVVVGVEKKEKNYDESGKENELLFLIQRK